MTATNASRILRSARLSLCVLCGFFIGCSKLVPAEGVVILDGKPLDGATLTFIPEQGKDEALVGPSVNDGRFQMYTKDKPGVRPGKYKVTVSMVEVKLGDKGLVVSMTERAPPAYRDAKKTPLEIDVPRGGKTDIRLELTSKAEGGK